MAENREVFRAWTKRVIKKYKDGKKRNKSGDTGGTGGTDDTDGTGGAASSSAGPAPFVLYDPSTEIDLFASDAPAPPSPITQMRCYFKLPDGHIDFVLVDQEDSFANVKGQLQAKYQMVPKTFELVLQGNVLGPTVTIRDVGLTSHDLLIVGGGRSREHSQS
jgi:hypothetical protein